MTETTFYISMDPSSSIGSDWYTHYRGDLYTLNEARDLARDLGEDLRLVNPQGVTRYYVHADGNYHAA